MTEEKVVLVVDDEEDLRDIIVYDLERKGFRVFSAENGKVAIEVLKANAIDLVITDVRMPVQDGVQLIKNIKGQSFKKNPAVMFISGFTDMLIEEAHDLGAEAFFEKPFDRKAFFEAIQKALTPIEKRWFPVSNDPRSLPRIDGQVTSLGRGGMFLSTDSLLPKRNQVVSFDLKVDSMSVRLEGTGIVRWARQHTYYGNPGCGVEFLELSHHSRPEIISLIQSVKPHAFIPMK